VSIGSAIASGQKAQIQQAIDQADETALRLLNRVVSLTIAFQPTPAKAGDPSNPTFFTQQPNAIEVTSLRVSFEVKKNLGKEPNTCTCTVYNLSKSTRTELDKRPLYAILRAGHDGVARHLFSGNVTYAFSRRNGTEWETKLQIADGQRAFAFARMSRSYKQPVSGRQVLGDAAASMGLALPPEAEQSPELRQALSGSFVAHGPTRDVMTRLLAPYGFGWSVQDGRLQVLSTSQVNQQASLIISQEFGMIGSPERSIPHKSGDPSDLTVEALLYPEVCAGQQIDVRSQSLTGTFKVQDVHHRGDTHGNEWTTTIKALPLGVSRSKHRRK
jgi:hypothetical protein